MFCKSGPRFSQTRYLAFRPEMILVAVSPHHSAVGCHYFPPGLRLPFQPKRVTAHRSIANYIAWRQKHIRVSSLPKDDTWKQTGRDSNPCTTLWVTSERFTVKPAFHDADTDILADILARKSMSVSRRGMRTLSRTG